MIPAQGFWDRVTIGAADACWPWKRACSKAGYGVAWSAGKLHLAHRIAYMLTHNGIPDGTHILHSCDNPPCCNPAHLRAGTPKENAADARERKGCFQRRRGNHPKERWSASELAALLAEYDVLPKRVNGHLFKGARQALLSRHGVTEGGLDYALECRRLTATPS